MNRKIKAGIIGGAGYTGGETLRLLLQHPFIDIAFVHSRSNTGAAVTTVHQDLAGDTDLMFTADTKDVDVLFLCLGHGASRSYLENHTIAEHTKIIDLSQDFRLSDQCVYGTGQFVYGLPECNREEIKTARMIANPGCFATALQLALLPLAKKKILREAVVTGITGATGAGQQLQPTSHFAWRTDNISAYKTLAHQHCDEVMQTMRSAQPDAPELQFIPWRGDFARGIYLSAFVKCAMETDELMQLYENYYQPHAFTFISKEMIHLKQVVNTNKCLLFPEMKDGKLVIHAAIDNLLKGAAGQAVQNMNLMFGWEETTGLHLKPSAF